MTSAIPTDGLISWWKLDETTGTRVDSNGYNDLDQSSASAPGYSSTAKWGNSMDIEATNSEYRARNYSDLVGLNIGDNDFTMGGWFRWENIISGYSHYMVGKWDDVSGNYREYLLFMSESTRSARFYVSADGSSSANAANSQYISTGTWYLVIGWHDASANYIYCQVNNNTPASTAWSNGINSGFSQQFKLGCTRTGNGFDGLVDEFFCYDRVLTSTERTQIYNSGNGATYGAQATPRHVRRGRIAGESGYLANQGDEANRYKRDRATGLYVPTAEV